MRAQHKVSAWIGSFLVSILLIPAIMTVIKQKSAKDLSYIFLSIQATMGFFFLVFQQGVYEDSGLMSALPGFISNTISIVLTFVLIRLKYKYDKESKQFVNKIK
jgi:uncharacterized protein with PQ loop repeat